jgi:hypothetical protein
MPVLQPSEYDISYFDGKKSALSHNAGYSHYKRWRRYDNGEYAYDQASSSVQPYLTVADARTYLDNYSNNEFDLLYSRWFLECISDTDLPDLIKEMNRVSKQQVHIVFPQTRNDYYNPKSVQDWLDFKFAQGTAIIDNSDLQTIHTK